MVSAFCVSFKISFSTPKSWSYLSMLSSGSVTVLHWDQKPKVLTDSVYSVWSSDQISLFPQLVIQWTWLCVFKRLSFTLCSTGCHGLKWSIFVCMSYFLAFYFIPLVTLTTLVPLLFLITIIFRSHAILQRFLTVLFKTVLTVQANCNFQSLKK